MDDLGSEAAFWAAIQVCPWSPFENRHAAAWNAANFWADLVIGHDPNLLEWLVAKAAAALAAWKAAVAAQALANVYKYNILNAILPVKGRGPVGPFSDEQIENGLNTGGAVPSGEKEEDRSTLGDVLVAAYTIPTVQLLNLSKWTLGTLCEGVCLIDPNTPPGKVYDGFDEAKDEVWKAGFGEYHDWFPKKFLEIDAPGIALGVASPLMDWAGRVMKKIFK